MHWQQKQGHVAWKDYRDDVRMCTKEFGKDKAQMELYLTGDAKNNKKGFCRKLGKKRKAKESILPLISGKRELATAGIEKAELFNKFFASIRSHISLISHVPEPLGGCWGMKIPLNGSTV